MKVHDRVVTNPNLFVKLYFVQNIFDFHFRIDFIMIFTQRKPIIRKIFIFANHPTIQKLNRFHPVLIKT